MMVFQSTTLTRITEILVQKNIIGTRGHASMTATKNNQFYDRHY